MSKQNLVIQTKELPKTLENNRKNWYTSREGKASLRQAQEHQVNLQGKINEKMSEEKQQHGTTGMSNSDYENFFGDMLGQNSHQSKSLGSSSAVKRYRYVRGKGMVRVR